MWDLQSTLAAAKAFSASSLATSSSCLSFRSASLSSRTSSNLCLSAAEVWELLHYQLCPFSILDRNLLITTSTFPNRLQSSWQSKTLFVRFEIVGVISVLGFVGIGKKSFERNETTGFWSRWLKVGQFTLEEFNLQPKTVDCSATVLSPSIGKRLTLSWFLGFHRRKARLIHHPTRYLLALPNQTYFSSTLPYSMV